MGKVIPMPGRLSMLIDPALLDKVRRYCRNKPRFVRAFVEEALADHLLAARAAADWVGEDVEGEDEDGPGPRTA